MCSYRYEVKLSERKFSHRFITETLLSVELLFISMHQMSWKQRGAPFHSVYNWLQLLMWEELDYSITHHLKKCSGQQDQLARVWKYLHRIYSCQNELPKCFLTACILWLCVISFLTLCAGVRGHQPGQVSYSHPTFQRLKSHWGQWLTPILVQTRKTGLWV